MSFGKSLIKRREWKDLAERNSVTSNPGLSSKPYYPGLYLNSKQIGMPNIKAGDEVLLTIRAKVTSVNTTSSETSGESSSYSFELLKLKIGNGSKEE